jgi:hypothetical protein
MIAVGYFIETTVFVTTSLVVFAIAAFQVFYCWKLPHNENRVFTLHKATFYTILAVTPISLVTCIDHRGVYGIYPPLAILALAVLMMYPIEVGLLYWYKELMNIVQVSTLSHEKIQRFLKKINFGDKGVFALTAMYVLLSGILFTVSAINGKLWHWIFLIFYLDIFALLIFISSAFISRLLWLQYQSLKVNVTQSAALQGELIAKPSKESSVDSRITAGSRQAATGTKSVYQGNYSRKGQQYLKTAILTTTVAVMSLSFVLIMIASIDKLSTQNLTVQSEFSPDPQTYRVSEIAIALFLLAIVSSYSMWLPMTEPQKQVPEETAEEEEIKGGYFPLPKCCVQKIIKYLMSR